MIQWIQTEREQMELGLVHVKDCYWRDKNDEFWFSDETHSDVCGPFKTLEVCQNAATDYANNL